MKLYVGLDVGLEETSLCIVDGEGLTVREVRVMTEPAAIRSAVEGYADRLDRVGVEASSLGIWLYRELQPAGVPIIVVEARHMRVSLSTMRNKTDRNDARGIAQMMRLGWYRAVHVKNIDMQKMRTLLTSRKLLKRKQSWPRAGPGCLDSAPLDLSGFLPGYAERGALRFCRCVGRA
ncbi:IS110 family transposase [Bradyrhizobium japonicum]|uniref:IS110 family transposase n=1 Tax=Bradyrhizobium japonicum TaxID=375 RepID=UPI0004267BB1|nr:transposase [Bradyrhizobium japonicum]WLB86594.1 transposase [Bradyrhizobium japonicum USDA 135]